MSKQISVCLKTMDALFIDSINPFANNKFWILPNQKSLQMTILGLGKMAESSQKGRKHCGERRNCSFREISPFSSVFKGLLLQTSNNQGLFGKGLTYREAKVPEQDQTAHL